MRVYPTAYLPPISYFCALLNDHTEGESCISLIIEQHETYPKQTLRNRCEITGSNGKQILSVPVCRAEQRTTEDGRILATQETCDVKINYHTPWQHQHWMALVSAYQHTPFFFYYQDFFRPLYETCFNHLLQWNNALLKVVFQLLDMPCKIELTSQWERADENVLFCHADNRYAERKSLPPYWQIFSDKNGFLENLSIVDLLFNLGTEAKNYLYNYAKRY